LSLLGTPFSMQGENRLLTDETSIQSQILNILDSAGPIWPLLHVFIYLSIVFVLQSFKSIKIRNWEV
jgi:hypothetical protein